MKVGLKPTKTELVLLLLAVLFAGTMLLLRSSQSAESGWQITPEREAKTEQALKPVNINIATEEELIAVEGIGPTLAQRIVAYREEHGPFASIEELDNVKGIGMSLIENIRYLICTEDTP